MMPQSVAMRTYREHQAFYDKLQHDVARDAARQGQDVDPDAALAQVAGERPRLTGDRRPVQGAR